MNESKEELDFERNWQDKLTRGIDQTLGKGTSQEILEGGKALQDQSPTAEKITWTCQALDRLAQITDEKTRQEILTQCACHYPVEDLQDVKAAYQENGDVEVAIRMLQEKFEFFLRETLELESGLINTILKRGWGQPGIRDAKRIIATKIPKSGSLR